MDGEDSSSDSPDRSRGDSDQPPSTSRTLQVDVVDPGSLLSAPDRLWVRDLAREAGEALEILGEVRVKVVGDAEMTAAHERHKGVGGTTDVLTFDLCEGVEAELSGRGGRRVVDADLLVCIDEAARQAARRGMPARQELLLYVVHGILHCLGHDDATETGAARMHEREDEVLSRIGVGMTYASGEGVAS